MFITFEGLDGSGKSTQARMFTDWLNKKQDRHAVLTREPGGWEGVAVLRDIVISGRLKHPWSEAYLFMLDRAEHVANVIQPSLDKSIAFRSVSGNYNAKANGVKATASIAFRSVSGNYNSQTKLPLSQSSIAFRSVSGNYNM